MRALGFNVKKPEVVKLAHDVDPHNNGTIEYESFLEISEWREGAEARPMVHVRVIRNSV